ncbi:MAG TPA: hypothetical protein VFP68_22655 [Burkholderiaceae bacterium]|nr:hypothetical protein [Burkholderiaceae bacterium]
MNRRRALALLAQIAASVAEAAEGAREVAGKRILWVDSYHEGNPWNDGIGRGIVSRLQESGVELHVVHMDTARHADDAFAREAGWRAKLAADDFKPDVVIATDDAAAKYFVVPYLKSGPVPVVFAGINWDASAYGFPASNVTGMVEVDLVKPLVRALRDHAQGDRVAYLSADTRTQAKVVATYNKRFFGGRMSVRLVRIFTEFKRAYLESQRAADMLITGNYAGITGWDEKTARAFVMDSTRIPSGYVDGYMTPLVLITMGKVPEEQGEYAAGVALKILHGAKPADFPLVENKKAVLGLNLLLAEKLGIVFGLSMLKNASIVYRGE